jgi:hypothetical protein
VAVANGDRLTCPSSCADLPIIVGSKDFTFDYYGLSLGLYDMVLGIQWLESLRPILWDFARHTMGFVCNGRCIFWATVPTTLEPPFSRRQQPVSVKTCCSNSGPSLRH